MPEIHLGSNKHDSLYMLRDSTYDNDTVCPKCGNHINGDTNSEVKERNNISPSELTEDSAVSDKTILDRLYADHVDRTVIWKALPSS